MVEVDVDAKVAGEEGEVSLCRAQEEDREREC